jgi:chemotaxis protein MotB
MRRTYSVIAVVILCTGLTGCNNRALIEQKDREIEARDQTIMALEQELKNLEQEQERSDRLNEDLEAALSELQDKEQLLLQSDDNQSMITLPNRVTFDSGSASLTPEGMAIIDAVWGVLSRYPDRQILVEGHTDNVPIAAEYRSKYPSNWELSAARALAVVHHVQSRFKTDPKRLAAVGCGKYRPIADNNTEEGRADNRRVVVVVAKPAGSVAQTR